MSHEAILFQAESIKQHEIDLVQARLVAVHQVADTWPAGNVTDAHSVQDVPNGTGPSRKRGSTTTVDELLLPQPGCNQGFDDFLSTPTSPAFAALLRTAGQSHPTEAASGGSFSIANIDPDRGAEVVPTLSAEQFVWQHDQQELAVQRTLLNQHSIQKSIAEQADEDAEGWRPDRNPGHITQEYGSDWATLPTQFDYGDNQQDYDGDYDYVHDPDWVDHTHANSLAAVEHLSNDDLFK